ncbi:phosphatidylinositol 4-phosphate 3-kinase C2 domain-containing subunit gamma [Pelobates cultripes]|uniref:Phosphatidylinositol 4-phosphate 3-kinase C2 domain-containing subunit gamma n=1 Tax=Pelobates cultripes TaxID=61616 RepID=A0AAD1RW81_PELCU|nr:phosphatidylinositol 4-phosphate 3-kinase C2 domain-containing subunit gamma [Pelobates cultripes]
MYSLRSHIALLRLNSVQLRLRTDTSPGLARTSEDDQLELDLSENLEHAHYWKQSKERIANAVGQYGHFAECLLRNQLSVHNLLEAVKEICYLLRSVETKAIKNALTSLLSVNLQATPAWTSPHSQVPVQNALLQLSDAIAHLINIYSRSFQTDFHAAEPHGINRDVCPAIADPYFKFHLYAVHNLPENWLKSNVYFLSCSVIYAGRKLCPETRTQNKSVTKSLFSLVIWDEVISFPFTLHSLPYESMLILKLWGVKEASANGSFLAWTCLPLYSRQMMVQGNLLLNMISHMELPPVTTPAAFDLALPTLLTVQVDFPERNHIFNKPAPEELAYGSRTPFEDSSRYLDTLIHRNSVLFLSEADKRYLWNFRSCCDKPEDILPLLLGSAPGWDPPNISAMYQVLMDWDFTDPLEALGLLNSCFSDQQIRETACQQIGKLPNDELLQYLPQFVQAIKFEWDLDNALVRLLLQRSLQSVQIAHHLYWLLTDATNESHYKSMYEKLLAALQFCVGKAMNDEFLKQKRLVKTLQQIAEKVKGVQETKRQV